MEKLREILGEYKKNVDEQTATKLSLEKCDRIIQKLGSFASNCKECEQHFVELENHISRLKDLGYDYKQHKQIVDTCSSHLMKKHQIVSKGYYLSIYMSLGLAFGIVFGLLVFDNIAIGMPFGLAIGVGVGTSLDAGATKKGMTL